MVRLIEQTAVLCICVLYFWLIGNSWFAMAFSGYIWCITSLLLVLPFPESPRLLLAHGKALEFREAFDTLASWNKCKIDWSQVDLAKRIKSSEQDA